jgi:hypothetical protein
MDGDVPTGTPLDLARDELRAKGRDLLMFRRN